MANTEVPSRECARSGYVVGAFLKVPDDARYFLTPDFKYIVGCNSLRCNLCSGTIRQQIGFRDGEGAQGNYKAIYAEPDWSKSPFLVADAESRLYACGCTIVVVKGGQADVMPNRAWTCAGHPPTVNGAVLPTMTLDAANELVFFLANSQLTESINLLAIAHTDGTSLLATPANIGLGGEPSLKIWTEASQATMNPDIVDFAKVAGVCVQLKDKTLKAF